MAMTSSASGINATHHHIPIILVERLDEENGWMNGQDDEKDVKTHSTSIYATSSPPIDHVLIDVRIHDPINS